jgi:hypothetical protein
LKDHGLSHGKKLAMLTRREKCRSHNSRPNDARWLHDARRLRHIGMSLPTGELRTSWPKTDHARPSTLRRATCWHWPAGAPFRELIQIQLSAHPPTAAACSGSCSCSGANGEEDVPRLPPADDREGRLFSLSPARVAARSWISWFPSPSSTSRRPGDPHPPPLRLSAPNTRQR